MRARVQSNTHPAEPYVALVLLCLHVVCIATTMSFRMRVVYMEGIPQGCTQLVSSQARATLVSRHFFCGLSTKENKLASELIMYVCITPTCVLFIYRPLTMCIAQSTVLRISNLCAQTVIWVRTLHGLFGIPVLG